MTYVMTRWLSLWLAITAAAVVSDAMPWSTKHRYMSEEFEKMERKPMSHRDLIPDSKKFDDRVAGFFESRFGDSVMEHMMTKAKKEAGVSCDDANMDNSTFCLCMPSMPESTCKKMSADDIFEHLNHSSCPSVMDMAAKKKDNCVVKSVSDHMKSMDADKFKKTWKSMKSYQRSLSSRLHLKGHFSDVTDLEDFVRETDPEAKCTNNMKHMVKDQIKAAQKVPETLLPFANRKQLKEQMELASSEQKKDMLRQIRKFKEGCEQDHMSEAMTMKPDMEERKLRKPDVATVVGCNNIGGQGQWKLETADDVADKLACNLYERPEEYQKLCEPINHLNEDDREAAMEEKSQLCILHSECRNSSNPIPVNRHVMKCLSQKELNHSMSEARNKGQLHQFAEMACNSTGMKREQMEQVANEMAQHLHNMSSEEAARTDCVMKHIPIDTLKKAPFMSKDEEKKAFCQKMATVDQTTVNQTEVRAKSRFCSEAGVPITEQNELLVSAEPEDITDVTADEMVENPQMSYFMCKLETLREMAKKLKETYGEELANAENSTLSSMLPVSLGLDEPQECQNVYRTNYGDILNTLNAIIETCTGDIVEAAETRLKKVIELCEDVSVVTEEVSPSRRKRGLDSSGAEKSYGCQDLIDNVPMKDRSVRFLSQISCDVFLPTSSCLTQVTDVDGYDSEQLEALATKLFKCNANAGKSADLTPNLCVLVLGIQNATQLADIKFISENNIDCAGSKTNTKLDPEQLKIYYNKYMTDNAISSVSDLTKEQVAEMGIMLCGMPTSDIEKFSVYSEMSSVIDAYQCFDQDQLQAWAKKDAQIFGTEVDSASLERLYYVTAGLSDEVYQTFEVEQVRSIPIPVFSKIPANKLNQLRTAAICAISKEQADTIPDDVMKALSEKAKGIIAETKKDVRSSACPSNSETNNNEENGASSNNNGQGGNQQTDNNDENGASSNNNGQGGNQNTNNNDENGASSNNNGQGGNQNTNKNYENGASSNNNGQGGNQHTNNNEQSGNTQNNNNRKNGNDENNNRQNGNQQYKNDRDDEDDGSTKSRSSNSFGDKSPSVDLDDIDEYKPMPSTYDFKRSSEHLTPEEVSTIDVHRVSTSSIKELDDDSILKIAEQVCDSPDHDKKAFIKDKIKKIYDKLDNDQIKKVMGCVPVDLIETADASTLLPLMKGGKIGKDTPQAHVMAEKTTDILKNSLTGKGGPTPDQILESAGSVLCLMPAKLFQEAVDAVRSKPDLLKELMENYTGNCGNRDPSRVKLLADSLSKTVTLKNMTSDEIKAAMKNNSQVICSASQELKQLPEDKDLLGAAMTSCSSTREEVATRASTSYKNLAKYFTQIDAVSSEWQKKLRDLDWANVDVSEAGILDYFIPLLKSDYDNITKARVCTGQKLPDVLGYPQVALGSMMYYFCKSEYGDDFSKFKQLGIHAPTSEITKNAKPADVRNLKKAIYMVPKSKFQALSDVANKDFDPQDSKTFQNAQYTVIGLPMSQLNQTKEEDRGMLCDMMACNAITAFSSKDIEEKLTFCKQYLNWENFLCAHSPAIKEQFMVAASGLTMKTIQEVNTNCSEINDNLVGLAAAVTSCDVRKWLYTCAKENGRGFTDTGDLEIYSQLVDQISNEDFDKISDENKCNMWKDVIREESKRRTDLIDFRMNINSALTPESCYGVNNTVTIDHVMAMKAACEKLNRKKRETSGMTCSEFLSYGNNREYLVSAQDISSMPLDEFKACIIDIGATSGFTAEHWQAAADIAKQVYGDVSTWTSDTIKDVGGITSGLTIEDLKKLKLTDLEAASVIGSTGTWDSNKLATVFERFKADFLNNDMKNINTTHLVSIGELNCGATSVDIENIKPIVYCDAADKIGALKDCEAAQKQAFVELAKDPVCFGTDVSTWSPDSIRLLGSQLGGLAHDDITKLNGDQLQEIDRLAIEQLPPNVINAFSLDQLQMFDPDQVSVFTPEQMQSLDPQKRNIVELKAKSTSENDDGENSAGFFKSSTLLLITMVMASILYL